MIRFVHDAWALTWRLGFVAVVFGGLLSVFYWLIRREPFAWMDQAAHAWNSLLASTSNNPDQALIIICLAALPIVLAVLWYLHGKSEAE